MKASRLSDSAGPHISGCNSWQFTKPSRQPNAATASATSCAEPTEPSICAVTCAPARPRPARTARPRSVAALATTTERPSSVGIRAPGDPECAPRCTRGTARRRPRRAGSRHEYPTVHVDRLADNEARGVCSQERHHLANLLGLADPPDRDVAHPLLPDLDVPGLALE